MSALHQFSPPENRPGNLAALSVVRYVQPFLPLPMGGSSRSRWTWLLPALMTGILFGFGLNFCFDVKSPESQHVTRISIPNVAQTIVSVPSHTGASASPVMAHTRARSFSSEVEQIKIRNRRLEALVKVLRQRQRPGSGTTSRPG